MARFKLQEILHAALKAFLEGATTSPVIKIPAAFISQLASLAKEPQRSDSKHYHHGNNASINWLDIDKALGELMVHEEGILFQRLAIALAKQQWSEIIATQPHKDGGQDAYIPYFTSNDHCLSVGCSITATYDKIKKDAKRIVDRGLKLDTFIFYTPAKTSNCKFDEWSRKLKTEMGCDLQPKPREDIIHELIKPDNHWMCREFLKLKIPYSSDVPAVSGNARIASQEIIDQWKVNLLSDTFLVELTISEKIDNDVQDITHEEIAIKLSNKHRLVLYGSPGSGKTTTLIQIAQKLIEQGSTPFIISLPEWVNSANDNLIDFLADNPCVSSKHITSENLLSLYKHGKLILLINGWNEVEPSNIQRATRLLTRVNREYTGAGIIVATRENSFTPPFLDESKLVINELSDSQRSLLIQKLIHEDISGQIESNHSLSQITRTPLFLIELINSYQANGTLPKTRVEIFEQFIRRIESSVEHSISLKSPPLSERSEYYLTWLASNSTRAGQVIIKHNNACREISEASKELHKDGQLQTVPEPNDILNILCDHHVLVKSNYPDNTVRFVHQQLQEYYAYLYIKNWLQTIIENKAEEEIRQFQEDVINYPVWEESLLLLAEEISEILKTSQDKNILEIGEYLVRWTIPVDPVFAATLVKVLGNTIWNVVKTDFEPILRKWYEYPDDNHKACALTAIFATGTDSFCDIIWPLLEHEDSQIRLKTYNTTNTFTVNSLGNNWQSRVNSWSEDRRIEFLNQLSYNCTIDAISIFEDYAQNDPSTKVKVAAINALGWYAPRNKLHEILSTCNDETFKTVIRHDYIINKFPDNMIPKATKFYLHALTELESPRERLMLLLKMNELCGLKVVDLLKRELKSFQPEKTDSFINDVIKIIASEDSKWISLWICHKVTHGNLHYDYYSEYITEVPIFLIDELLKQYADATCPSRLAYDTKELIAIGANFRHIHFILKEISKSKTKFENTSSLITESDRNIYHRFLDVARIIPIENLVTVILKKYQSPKGKDLNVILDLLGTYRIQDTDKANIFLKEKKRSELRRLLCKYSNLVLKKHDFSGVLKADLSCAIALFGNHEDLAIITKLIKKDIRRRREAIDARIKGVKHSPQTNGGSTCWANWHIKGLLRIPSDAVEKLLIDLLDEPEYQNDAANGLVQLLWKDIPKEKTTFIFHAPLTIGSCTWREKYIDPAKRKCYAQAIAQRINAIRQENKESSPKTLAGHLAKLNAPETIPLILEVLSMPVRFDGYNRMHILEMLVRNGHCLDTNTVEGILRPAIEQATDIRISGKQDFHLMTQCLCILACSDKVENAVSIIDGILVKHNLCYDLRGLIETLGYRKTSEAAKYLIHLCQDKRLYDSLCYELIEALGNEIVPEANQALLSTIDNNITSNIIQMPNSNGRTKLTQVLSEICETDQDFQDRIISICNDNVLSQQQKSVVLAIINNCPSNTLVMVAVSMLSKINDDCRVPYELSNSIEKCMIEYVPIDHSPNSYNLIPRNNNEIGKKLFNIVINKDGNWMFSFKLLGFINRLRVKHGKPLLEPRHPEIETHVPWPTLDMCDQS